MTNTVLLNRINELASFAVESDAPINLRAYIAALRSEIENEILIEELTKTKRLKPYRLAMKILSSSDKDFLHYAHILKDGRQLVTDGFRILIFDSLVAGLPAPPENIDVPDWEYIIYRDFEKPILCELELPSLPALNAYIKIEKAKGNKKPVYDFGACFPVVNAIFLADFIAATGAQTAESLGALRPLIFKGCGFNVYLFPLNSNKSLVREKTRLPEVVK